MAKEAYSYDVYAVEHDDTHHQRPNHMAKEAYLHGKRDLLMWQKRPAPKSTMTCTIRDLFIRQKKTYLRGKRGLIIWQNRPAHMAKEAYAYGKRDLLSILAYLRHA